MKKTTLFLIAVPALLLMLAGCAPLKSGSGKSGTTLSYTMKPGKSFTLKSESLSTIVTDQMGQAITVEMNNSSETKYKTLALNPDGSTTYELEYKTMQQSAKSPMGDNSTDYSSWLGKKVQFNVSPRGTISGFSGFDHLPEITSATGEKITGELIQKGMPSQFFELPDHPVKIGETWTVNTSNDIPYGGGMLKQEETTVYTVTEKMKKDGLECLRLDAAGTEKLAGEFEQQGMQLEMTRETKSTSVIYFAIEKGMYVSFESTAAAKGQVYVPAASITIPQNISSKQTLKVVFD